jgi:hypothetical protein
MGADFTLLSLSWDKNRKLNWSAGFKALKKYCKDPKNLDEDGNLHTSSDMIVDEDSLEGCIKSIKSAVEGTCREATCLEYGHLKILVTGGMSWGDDPSDLMGDIYLLMDTNHGEILNAIGFDQDLQDYKGILQKVLKVKALQPLLMGLDKELDTMLEKELSKCPRKRKLS